MNLSKKYQKICIYKKEIVKIVKKLDKITKNF